jgi:hypothetical protein
MNSKDRNRHMRYKPGIEGFVGIGRVPILLSPLFIIAIVTIVSGCYDSSLPGLGTYDVKISGLDGLNGSGNTQIYIPMPMEGDAPLFLNKSLYVESPGWSSRVIDTPHGMMYCLYTNNTSPGNVTAYNNRGFFNISLNDEIAIIRKAEMAPLYPVSNETAPYTYWLSSDLRKKNYTSYIYLEGIKPSGGNVTINFLLELKVWERSTAGQRTEGFNAEIIEDIPANASGWIPVTVQILK